jgi:DNA-binding transcriptional LysR family regulator
VDRFTALNAFRHAAELGSFARAARHLGLSPAAISKNIGELEADVAARLFHRTTRRMRLTEVGALYYERVARALDDLAEADGALGAMQAEPRGRLRVSAPLTVTLTALSSGLPCFLERHPEVSLDLHLDDRRVDLIEGGFDLAIRGSDALEDSTLVATKLFTMTHVLCGAPAYFEAHGVPQNPRDLADHRLVRFALSGHANRWQFTKAGAVEDVPITGRYAVTSSLAVRDALRAGFGMSMIPRMYVRDDCADGTLVTVLDDWSCNETPIYAVYPSRKYLQPKVRVFLDFLKAELSGADD